MSDLLSSDVVVGGRSFRLQKIPARRAGLILNRLLRLITPSVAQITGSLSIQVRFLDMNTSNFAPALTQFFSTFTEEEQTRLFDEMFEGVRYKSDKGEWLELRPFVDEVFTGKVADMFRLLVECIKFQFADFKNAFTAALNAFEKKAATSSQIPMQ